jgi:hypothetical protein
VAIERDLVDLTLTCNLYLGLKYGALHPNDEDWERRSLQAKVLDALKAEIEEEAINKLAEALGYDNETLEKKLMERAAQQAQDKKAEEDGHKLRQRQRSGQG